MRFVCLNCSYFTVCIGEELCARLKCRVDIPVVTLREACNSANRPEYGLVALMYHNPAASKDPPCNGLPSYASVAVSCHSSPSSLSSASADVKVQQELLRHAD